MCGTAAPRCSSPGCFNLERQGLLPLARTRSPPRGKSMIRTCMHQIAVQAFTRASSMLEPVQLATLASTT